MSEASQNQPQQPRCAHLHVGWVTQQVLGGMTNGWWACRTCQARFEPQMDRLALQTKGKSTSEAQQTRLERDRIITNLLKTIFASVFSRWTQALCMGSKSLRDFNPKLLEDSVLNLPVDKLIDMVFAVQEERERCAKIAEESKCHQRVVAAIREGRRAASGDWDMMGRPKGKV